MKKSIFLFFAAIMCAVSMQAAFNQSAVDLYFDNSEAQWTNCYVYIGHGSHTCCYPMSRVSGTQYLWKLAKGNFNGGNTWSGANGWVVSKDNWWASSNEDVYKFVYHGNNNVTDIYNSAWDATKIYKATGTHKVRHYDTDCNVYKWDASDKTDYKVTIKTANGGTLTVKDYDNNIVNNGASKSKLTVLKFSASASAGYTFDGVQINNGNSTTTISAADINSKTYTLTSAVTITPIFSQLVTVYAINSVGWGTLACHHWLSDSEATQWPGTEMTKTSETVHGFDVYSVSFTGKHTYCIFNNNNNGAQTENLDVQDGKYYDLKSKTWYASLAEVPSPDPYATDVYLVGEMTDWGTNKVEFRKTNAESTTASVTVNLNAGTYSFKLIISGAWKGNTGTMQRGGDKVHTDGWSFEEDGGEDKNCKIKADEAGEYIFTWNLTTKKLTVTFPTLPKYNVIATATNGSVIGVGEYEKGATATLKALPDNGFVFVSWTTKGGVKVSNNADYSFTVTEDTELVANFEKVHNVTISYLFGAKSIETATTVADVGVSTPREITAPSISGYTFLSWKLGAGVVSSDVTKQQISITTKSGETDYTLVANYEEDLSTGWYLAGEFGNNGNNDTGWSADKIEFKKLPGESAGTISYVTLDLLPTTFTDGFDMMFKVMTEVMTESQWYGNNSEYKKANDKQDWEFTENANNCNLDVSLPGTYTFCLNTNKEGKVYLSITYPIVNQLQIYNASPAHSDAVANWSWDSQNANECVKTLSLNATTQYTFKVVTNSEFFGNSNLITRAQSSSQLSTSGGNVTIKTDIAGDYTFIWNVNDKKLAVAYPLPILTSGDNREIISALKGQTLDVKLDRTFKAKDGYYTICLPFDLKASEIGKAYQVDYITEHVAEQGFNMVFKDAPMLEAGQPYLILPEEDLNYPTFENVTITYTGVGETVHAEGAGINFDMIGKINGAGSTNGLYWVGNNGYFYNDDTSILGLRTYFSITDNNGTPLNIRARVVVNENAATSVDNITNTDNTTIKVIENGQLIIIRNGEKFNAQGVRL